MQLSRSLNTLKLNQTPTTYIPQYGGADRLGLQTVLHQASLPYRVTSTIQGYWGDRYLTLEEFLIESQYPHQYTKSLIIHMGSKTGPFKPLVRELYVTNDVLYMNVIGGGADCQVGSNWTILPGGKYPLGLMTHPVWDIESIQLPEGELWQIY